MIKHSLQALKILSLSSLIALTATHAHADRLLGIFLGAHTWQQDFSGSVTDLNASSGNTFSIEDDLGLSDNDNNVIYAALEHPIFFLPSVMLRKTDMTIDGNGTVTGSRNFGLLTFSASEQIATDVDLSHLDTTLYYQILDNFVSLDIGLTWRDFSGYIEVVRTTTNDVDKRDFDEGIPLGYAKARVDLPFSGAYASGALNIISYDGNSVTDLDLTVGWEGNFGLGAEAGYRTFDVELNDVADVDADLSVKGIYLGLFYHF